MSIYEIKVSRILPHYLFLKIIFLKGGSIKKLLVSSESVHNNCELHVRDIQYL